MVRLSNHGRHLLELVGLTRTALGLPALSDPPSRLARRPSECVNIDFAMQKGNGAACRPHKLEMRVRKLKRGQDAPFS
jgi:hypothetical protein